MARDVGRYGNHGSLTLLVAGALIATSGRFAPCQTCYVGPSATVPVMADSHGQMPAYEVATIKPSDGKDFAMPLRVYIQGAFGISPNIAGRVIGPGWIENTRYVIDGKPPDSIRDAMQTMTAGERAKENALMKQSLLADRFQLKAHFETREMPAYELVPAKGGAKFKAAPDPTHRQMGMGASSFRGSATIHDLISTLECAADIGGRAVIDKTGLAGTYDLSLKWTPMEATPARSGASGGAPTIDADGASLFTAIHEQLGLKLVPTKGPGQVLVIDHIERPSEN